MDIQGGLEQEWGISLLLGQGDKHGPAFLHVLGAFILQVGEIGQECILGHDDFRAAQGQKSSGPQGSSRRQISDDLDRLQAVLINQGTEPAGHGSHVRAMLPLGWPEWSAAVRCEFYALKKHCDHVFLIGHSLGGALCLHIAAHEDVAGVVAICAPLYMRPWLRSAVHIAKHITPLVPTLREDIRDPIARRKYTRDVYRWTPMAPVANMLKHLPLLRHELPHMRVPALVIAAKRLYQDTELSLAVPRG